MMLTIAKPSAEKVPLTDVAVVSLASSRRAARTEYHILPGRGQLFRHHAGDLPASELEDARAALLDLCRLEHEIAFEELDEDCGEFEESQRRAIRLWCGGARTSSTRPTPQFFTAARINPTLDNAFGAAFEAAWGIVARWIDRAREAAGPPTT